MKSKYNKGNNTNRKYLRNQLTGQVFGNYILALVIYVAPSLPSIQIYTITRNKVIIFKCMCYNSVII